MSTVMPPPRLASLGAIFVAALLVGISQDRAPRAAQLAADAVCRPFRSCGPTAPGNLAARPAGPNGVALSWSPSSARGSAIVRYRVWRNGSSAGRTQGTTYTVL